MSVFIHRGPLAPDSRLFCGRRNELEGLLHLCQGEVSSYAIVYGGRQNGKTSLLLRLEAALSSSARVCLVDFQALPGAEPARAYAFLAGRIAESLRVEVPPVNDETSLIAALGTVLRLPEVGRLVLMLEELGALPLATRQSLANVLRSCFTGRHTIYRSLARLVIVLAGGVELYDLAATEVSTLHNICEEYYLGNLEVVDARDLIVTGLGDLGVAPAQAAELAQAVYGVTAGHPYLTQRLGAFLEATLRRGDPITPALLEDAVAEILRGDSLLRHLRRGLDEQGLLEASRDLLEGKLRFSRMDEDLARLELLGLAGEHDRRWQVRNQLLDLALRSWLGAPSVVDSRIATFDVLPAAADLEIWLQQRTGNDYGVVISFTPPGSAVVEQPASSAATAQFDLERLLSLTGDPMAYGATLTAMLCANGQVRDALIAARNRARGASVALRLRLRLNADDPLLPGIRWELLQDPSSGAFLCTSAEVRFSRFPTSRDDTSIVIPHPAQLRVLVAVAAPTDLAKYQLAPIDAAAELVTIIPLLAGSSVRTLPQASLATLTTALLEEPHLFYLIAHGAIIRGEPLLYLADDNGSTKPTPVAALVERMRGLSRRPNLIILASCQSAGKSHQSADSLIAIGPQLAHTGVGAVLAMSDNVTISAVQKGISTLIAELRRHGSIDQAVATMRNLLAAHGEQWWQPVLYLRLRDGMLFHPQ